MIYELALISIFEFEVNSLTSLLEKQRVMINVKKVEPQNMYLLEGQSSANSVFFETKADIRLFLKLANYFLKDYLKIHEYVLQKDSWMMVVCLKDQNQILGAYTKRRNKSKICKTECAYTEVWRIISDQMRLFLSQYVRQSNKLNEREGSLVNKNYSRSYFETNEECLEFVEKMRRRLVKRQQRKLKYRGLRSHFRVRMDEVEVLILMGSSWMANKERRKEVLCGHLLRNLEFIDFTSLVGAKLVKSTFLHHNPPKNPKSTQNSS